MGIPLSLLKKRLRIAKDALDRIANLDWTDETCGPQIASRAIREMGRAGNPSSKKKDDRISKVLP